MPDNDKDIEFLRTNLQDSTIIVGLLRFIADSMPHNEVAGVFAQMGISEPNAVTEKLETYVQESLYNDILQNLSDRTYSNFTKPNVEPGDFKRKLFSDVQKENKLSPREMLQSSEIRPKRTIIPRAYENLLYFLKGLLDELDPNNRPPHNDTQVDGNQTVQPFTIEDLLRRIKNTVNALVTQNTRIEVSESDHGDRRNIDSILRLFDYLERRLQLVIPTEDLLEIFGIPGVDQPSVQVIRQLLEFATRQNGSSYIDILRTIPGNKAKLLEKVEIPESEGTDENDIAEGLVRRGVTGKKARILGRELLHIAYVTSESAGRPLEETSKNDKDGPDLWFNFLIEKRGTNYWTALFLEALEDACKTRMSTSQRSDSSATSKKGNELSNQRSGNCGDQTPSSEAPGWRDLATIDIFDDVAQVRELWDKTVKSVDTVLNIEFLQTLESTKTGPPITHPLREKSVYKSTFPHEKTIFLYRGMAEAEYKQLCSTGCWTNQTRVFHDEFSKSGVTLVNDWRLALLWAAMKCAASNAALDEPQNLPVVVRVKVTFTPDIGPVTIVPWGKGSNLVERAPEEDEVTGIKIGPFEGSEDIRPNFYPGDKGLGEYFLQVAFDQEETVGFLNTQPVEVQRFNFEVNVTTLGLPNILKDFMTISEEDLPVCPYPRDFKPGEVPQEDYDDLEDYVSASSDSEGDVSML